MRTLTMFLALSLAACGGSSKPAPAAANETADTAETSETAETEKEPVMMEGECTDQGGTLAYFDGEPPQCEAGFIEVAKIAGEVPSVCCNPAPDDAE